MEQVTQKSMDENFTKPEFVNPYAATARNLEVLRIDEQPLAGRGTRLVAALIDIFSWLGISVIGVLLATLPKNVVSPTSAGLAFGGLLLAAIVMQLVFIHLYAQTIGKRIMKIRVVRASSGEQCDSARYIFLRTLAVHFIGLIPIVGSLFSLINVLMIFANDRRCLHDHLADTIVVKV